MQLKLQINLLLIWIYNALALLAVAYMLPGIQVDGILSALIAAFVLGLVNTVLRPLLILLTLQASVRTFGLFIFVINGLLFWLVGSMLDGFEVQGFWAGFFGALLYSLSSLLPLLFTRWRKVRQPAQRQPNHQQQNENQDNNQQNNNKRGPITIDHDPS